MMFKARFHDGIKDGSITLTYRSWKRTQAKVGNAYKIHAIGMIQVDAMDMVKTSAITEADAVKSGFDSVNELLRYVPSNKHVTDLCRVEFHYLGEDKRERLDLNVVLSDAEVRDLIATLAKRDRASRCGPWTQATLSSIKSGPGVSASVLAEKLGRDKASLKVDVRKLKKLGLTQSLEVGYRISPRGQVFIDRSGLDI